MRALVILLLAACCFTASNGFCVYNDCDGSITAFQLPISGASFKKVVDPGDSECCNWRDCGPLSPEAGRCGKAQFCMIHGSEDTDAVTASAVLDSINKALVKSFDFIPGIGAVGAANDAARDQLKNYGLNCDAVVSSFNGGIAQCTQGSFYGAWDGSNARPPSGTEDC